MYSFGKMYKSFKEELNTLAKFDLGESFEVWDYSDLDNEKEVTLFINNPNIVDNDSCYLNIVKKNNDINCYISTSDHEYYMTNNEIQVDKNFAEKYHKFISKYIHFIDCYNISKGNTMFENPKCLIINDYKGDLFNNLESIILKIDMDYHEYNYIAKIVFDLNTLSIDYDKSLVEGTKENKNDAINTIINGLYINKGRIASSYSDTEEDKTLRLKKGLDI